MSLRTISFKKLYLEEEQKLSQNFVGFQWVYEEQQQWVLRGFKTIKTIYQIRAVDEN